MIMPCILFVSFFVFIQDLVVRLCFVLGNVTAQNELARQRLFEEKAGVDTLLNVLNTYNQLDAQVHTSLWCCCRRCLLVEEVKTDYAASQKWLIRC